MLINIRIEIFVHFCKPSKYLTFVNKCAVDLFTFENCF